MKRFLAKRTSGNLSSGQVQRRRNRLTKLIIREDWKGLIDEVENSGKKATITDSGSGDVPTADEPMLHALLLLDTETNRSALHIVCRSHPPLQVVQIIVRLCPASVKHVDKVGHTPLHAASEWGASPRIVEFLIKRFPRAAAILDVEGKTPLHLCCENCTFEESSDTGSPWHGGLATNSGTAWPVLAKGPLLPVVKALLRAAPEVVNLEDNEDMNALEYAIMFNADVKIVKALQKASTEAWKLKDKKPDFSAQHTRSDKKPSIVRTSISTTASLDQDRLDKEHSVFGSSTYMTQFEKLDSNGHFSSEGLKTVLPAVANLSFKTKQRRNLKVPKAA